MILLLIKFVKAGDCFTVANKGVYFKFLST